MSELTNIRNYNDIAIGLHKINIYSEKINLVQIIFQIQLFFVP